MKTYVYKVFVFFSPFIFLYFITAFFYSKADGDLLRIGYITRDDEYRSVFAKEFNRSIYYENIDDAIDRSTKSNGMASVLIIGDSFSYQDTFGYKNYLAESDSIKVTFYNRWTPTALNELFGIANGDFFDKFKFDFVVFQNVERSIVRGSRWVNVDAKITIEQMQAINTDKVADSEIRNAFPPIEIIKFPLYNILYRFKDNAFLSQVYRVEIDRPLFSGKRSNELLFYEDDLRYVSRNNDTAAVKNLNEKFNTLSNILRNKGVKLIVLPSPDKYDFYYDFIINKSNYPRPLFFDHLEKLEKGYIYVNSKDILSASINKSRDIYFYDDSHWSPWASRLIANELSRIILDN